VPANSGQVAVVDDAALAANVEEIRSCNWGRHGGASGAVARPGCAGRTECDAASDLVHVEEMHKRERKKGRAEVEAGEKISGVAGL